MEFVFIFGYDYYMLYYKKFFNTIPNGALLISCSD